MSLKHISLSALMILSGSLGRAESMPAPGDVPGKNISEMTVRWMWYQLPTFVYACSKSSECGLNDNERAIAAKVSEGAASYKHDTVEFISEKENPGFFTASNLEAHRVAVTGDKPTDKIYLNSDRLDAQNTKLEYWAGILVHEMTHHAGVKDDAQRLPDIIGAKIAKALTNNLSALGFPDDRGDISVLALTMPGPNTTGILKLFPHGFNPHFAIIDPRGVYNMVMVGMELNEGPVAKEECGTERIRLTSRISPNRAIITPTSETRNRNTAIFSGSPICLKPGTSDVNTNTKSYALNFNSVLEKDGHYYFARDTVDLGVQDETRDDPSGFPNSELIDLQVPASVKAGETLTVTATIKNPNDDLIKDCAFVLDVPNLKAQRGTYGMYSDACKLTSLGNNTYRAQITRKIPLSTPAMKVELFSVCLSPGDLNKDGCYPANPKKVTYIEIQNSKAIPASQIKSIKVQGADVLNLGPEHPLNWVYFKNGEFTLEILVSNTSGIDALIVQAAIVNEQGQEGSLDGYLDSIPFLVQSHSFTQVGPDTLATYKMKITDMEGFQIKALIIDSLRIHTYDFKGVLGEFPNKSFVMGSPEYFKARGN